MKRARAYLEYLNCRESPAPAELVEALIKADRYGQYVDRIVTNALKADIHFLPADGQPSQASAIPEHGVVLFRRPITIDLEILDVAQESTAAQWARLIKEKAHPLRVSPHIKRWPIKLSTLRGEFLGDLLSRYVSMYIRLGSTDFSRTTIDGIVADMRTK